MEMHQIIYFLALCEERNFSRAAQRCDVAQPSLSKAIRNLELKLGGALFYRDKSETRLTKLGNLVKPRLQKIRLEAERAQEVAQNFSANSFMAP
jgi:LysR family hydrogen peroxide-inducible transcriptional activator